MTGRPRVCIVVLNFNGADDTIACLDSLRATTYERYEILVLDNGSTADETPRLREAAGPGVTVVRSARNLGFAGGCNAMIRRTDAPYVVLLNNDTVVEPDWLSHLVAAAEARPRTAAVQAKVVSFADPGIFEYAGAAGGMLDGLGIPYCRGRVVLDVEEDHGQYDDDAELFWASGVCVLLSREALDDAGLLAEDFFFYHEETDLCWRLRNRGYRITFAPGAVVRHKGSGSSAARVHRKIYYLHRNGLMMALRNCTAARLLWLLPVRLGLEAAAICYYLATRRPRSALAVLIADAAVLARIPRLMRQRRRLGGDRRVGQAGMRPFSVLWEYFVRRRRTYAVITGTGSARPSRRSDAFLARKP